MTKSFSSKNHRSKIGLKKRCLSSSSWGSVLTFNDEINSNEIYSISEQLNRSFTIPKVKNIYVNLKQDSITSQIPSSNSSTSSTSIQNSNSNSNLIHILKYSYCANFFDGCKEHVNENNPYNNMNYIDDIITQSAPASKTAKHNNHHIPGKNIKALNAEPFRKLWKWCTHSVPGGY